jgi:hypothetical protein
MVQSSPVPPPKSAATRGKQAWLLYGIPSEAEIVPEKVIYFAQKISPKRALKNASY